MRQEDFTEQARDAIANSKNWCDVTATANGTWNTSCWPCWSRREGLSLKYSPR